MSGTVLVTGATGFIGRHVVPHLVARGFTVRVALRRPAEVDVFGHEVTRFVVGDMSGDIDWRSWLRGADAVLHLAGIAHTSGISEDAYDRINRAATARLAEAARDEGARFVFVSSVRAQSGPAADGILTEDSVPAPTDAYGRSKLAAERDIAALGGPYVILRPTLVYGQGVRGNFQMLRFLASLPAPLLLGGIHNARSLLAVENFAAAISIALTSEAAIGGTFLVADPAPVSLAQILALLRKGVGWRPWLVPIPAAVYSAALTLAGQRDLRDRLLGNLVVSTARLEALGYAPVVSAETALPALGTSLKEVVREIRRRRA